MVSSLHFKYFIASLADVVLIWSLHAPAAMKKANRHSPAMTDLQQVETESKAVCHASLMRVKNNARQRRVKIRQLKYTCEAKIHVAVTGGGGNSAEEERKKSIVLVDDTAGEVREPMKISLSLTTSEKGDRSLVVQGDAVLEETGDREKLSYGSVSVIGGRKEMEDEVSVEIGFVVEESGSKCDFFAVYDGHGGPQVAKACRERLHQLVAEEVERHRSGDEVYWEGMMEGCFGKMDREVADDAAVRMVGSTAIVAVVTEEKVVIANCGDCRAVMGRGGETLVLSVDHKPDRPDELIRIEAAGGRVINWNGQRVLGVLATSRSIGDQHLRPYVISKPEVTVTKRTSEDEFLILASDGLWDVISSEVACQVVRKCFSRQIRRISTDQDGNQSRAAEAAAILAKLAMAKGSRDNTSVVVVELNNQNNL